MLSPEMQKLLDETFREVADTMVERVVEVAKAEATLVVIRILDDLVASSRSGGVIDVTVVCRVKEKLARDLEAKITTDLAGLVKESP